jgi:hypothetical protein
LFELTANVTLDPRQIAWSSGWRVIHGESGGEFGDAAR